MPILASLSFQRTAAVAVLVAAGGLSFAAQAQQQRQQARPAQQQPSFEEKMRQEKTYPTKVTWRLKSINDKPVRSDADFTLMIDDNFRGSGASGCNNWSATIFPVRGQKLAVGPIAITKRKCDNALMQLERNFLVAIHSGPAWDLVGSDLVMKGQSGTLVFQRAL